MEIPILYEDDTVVVIDKPAGLLVHQGDENDPEETVAKWHAKRVPEARGVGEPLVLKNGQEAERSGVVHRLDRDTSGVLILAKTQEAFVYLKAQFHDRLAEKTYRAFVYGEVKEKHGIIDRAIGRSASDFRLRSAQRGARGLLRPAVTQWELIAKGDGFSYLNLRPKTGRTHQLRVHLKAINHPIVCDALYAKNMPCELGFSRLALHAHTLTLHLPSGERMTFTATLPHEFEDAERRLGSQIQ